MTLRDQLIKTVDPLFSQQNGVFNTRYTISQLQDELERREEIIQKVEKRTDNHHKRKKKFLKKAAESRNQRKLRLMAKAKESEMNKTFYAELFDNLMVQQLFLTKLVLEAKRQRIFEDPMQNLGFDVDIASMNVEAVSMALEDSSIKQDEVQETIEQLEVSLDTADRDGLSLDLDELKEEADMLEASEIESESFDLGSDWDESIDQQIEEELDQLDDDSTATE
jgi:hypothetical protein